MITAVLKSGRDFSVRKHHPWIFSGAVARLDGGEPALGETVRVCADDGTLLGFGTFSPHSQIRVRLLTFAENAIEPDAAYITERVGASVGRRAGFFADGATNAVRLINAEADGLPGVVADCYAGWVVCQFTTAGAEYWKDTIVSALQRFVPNCHGVYERSDVDIRAHEGLEPRTGVLAGETPPDTVEIFEHETRYLVDILHGHKTGFYLDQRDNRAAVKAVANGCEVLNAFAYTGGFGVAAVTAGAARVTHVDLSAPALELAKRNTLLNTCHADDDDFIHGDVFQVLRSFRDARRSFDLVVLDPPKFADSKAALMKAARGYKDINLLGMKLLRPGGILATFSCSGLMTPDYFRKVVCDAAVDAKRDFQIIRHLQQSADHPEGLAFPEGLYLKGMLCRVL